MKNSDNSTSITEAGTGKKKKSLPSWVIAVGLIITLCGFGGLLFLASGAKDSTAYKPTADDIAQFKQIGRAHV